MAGQNEPVIDPQTGRYLTGRFAGRTPAEVAEYAGALEEEFEKVKPNAPATPTASTPAADPNKELNSQTSSRVASVIEQTTARLEAEDEAAFSSSVPDYDKYRPEIVKMKSRLAPEARLQRGLHETLYWNIKMQEPDFKEKMRATASAAPPAADPPAPTPDPPAPPAEPPAAPVHIPGVTPRAVPAPVSTPPTPAARRTSGTPPPEPTLKAPERLQKAAKAWGIPVEEYVEQLAARGMTQEDIDRESASREERRQTKPYNRSVYDRT